MTTNRRDFLKTGAVAAAALAAPRVLSAAGTHPLLAPPPGEAFADDLIAEALNAARDAGASYADVRIGRYRRQTINTRERQITGVADSESYGIGVRTIINGAWGFAATNNLTKDGVVKVAREAARLSRATKMKRPVELAPAPAVKGTWMTPITRDPLEISIEEKVAMLFAANEAALKVKGIRFVTSGLQLLREVKQYANSEGTATTQTFVRVGPTFAATAVGNGGFQQYEEELAPRGAGWEYVASLDMPGHAAEWAQIAVEKLSAKSVDPGRYDIIINPQNLWLTIHESIGHPTELDRAMGYEANYAGTSFVAPPEKMLGKLKYGSELLNIQCDRTQEQSLARVAWDDEGVAADKWLVIEKGIFKDYQTVRDNALVHLEVERRESIARLLVRRLVGQRAVPAHAERLAAARHEGAGPRRSRRGDRSRHSDQESRLVVDRSPALQLLVLRAGILRDPQRQDRGHAQGRGLSVEHAAVLGRDGHDRRAEVVLARRRVQRRQRRARAEQLGESWLSAGALPQHQHREHGEGRLMTKSLFAADNDFLSREQAQALSDQILSLAKADETRVTIASSWSRQHALRRQPDHDERRNDGYDRHDHVDDRKAARVGDDERARRRKPQAHGRIRRVAGEVESGGSGDHAGARAAAVRDGEQLLRQHRQPRSRDARVGGGSRDQRGGAERQGGREMSSSPDSSRRMRARRRSRRAEGCSRIIAARPATLA